MRSYTTMEYIEKIGKGSRLASQGELPLGGSLLSEVSMDINFVRFFGHSGKKRRLLSWLSPFFYV
jgi:hypothetical protein